jgi:hypothetical protein
MSRLAISDIIDDRYEIVDGPFLGGMSEVYRARDRITAQETALKVAREDVNPRLASHSADAELRALEEVVHPNVVRLVGSGLLNDRTLYLALEWLPKRLDNLVSQVGAMQWDVFLNDIGRPLLSALRYAHARRVAHRDLSWKNVLLTSLDQPKITDFGIARHMSKVPIGATFKGAGTFPFTPPEQDDGIHSYGRDCWSWAAIAASCLLGRRAETMQDLRSSLMKLPDDERPYEIFAKAWADDPKTRYLSAAELSADVEAFQRKLRALRAEVTLIPIVLQPSAVQGLSRIYGSQDPAPLQVRLIAELNDQCSACISRDGQTITVLGFDIRIEGKIASDGDRLVVREVLHMEEAVAARQRFDMVEVADFGFRVASSIYDGDKRALGELAASLFHGQELLDREQDRRRRERFFDACWRAISIRERRTKNSREYKYAELRRDGEY